MSTIDVETFLREVDLSSGGHGDRGTIDDPTVCATEAIAWLANEPHTSHPECLSPVLGQFLRTWNDTTDDAGRQVLKPYLSRCIGTAGDGHEELRGWLAGDWLVRVYTPAWLELAGITESAAALRALPPIRDLAALDTVRPVLDVGKRKAAAARAAAWDAARDAAWDAARAAAGDAAWDAAWDAARAAARAAAGAAAGAAARAAAEQGKSYDGQYEAAYEATRDLLKPTETSLKASALELLEALIDPTAPAQQVAA